MTTKLLKKYFLNELERENLEKQLLERFPELSEKIFQMDDVELLEQR
ncbi:hypothetical protein [Metabacillus fastidiosus]|uniref:Uncharacterized protein n=1 Tax=Metabacillus fastidiosus TaxID=1458 RepID=A0ABU6P4C6_9BACI|nr:hypothetical protein [Metabacillus fastidiosus]MEC2078315.1 hypothetical protein [Metabacillus fastidiosus]MED4403001.1 hypothetical protein [Metabacillus fastidiosus]MED4455231.1 hypothetical protein [Metabacillus fastidiosus]MED4461419.1 hypothetical protein [Metabacillus fastidiosus]MED4533846.1 hypothetical protein [Metabacillus fastidiosus]